MRFETGVPAPNLVRTRSSNWRDASAQWAGSPLVRGDSGFEAIHMKATANPATAPVRKTPSHFKRIANFRTAVCFQSLFGTVSRGSNWRGAHIRAGPPAFSQGKSVSARTLCLRRETIRLASNRQPPVKPYQTVTMTAINVTAPATPSLPGFVIAPSMKIRLKKGGMTSRKSSPAIFSPREYLVVAAGVFANQADDAPMTGTSNASPPYQTSHCGSSISRSTNINVVDIKAFVA